MPKAQNGKFLKYLILVDDSGLFKCTCFLKALLVYSVGYSQGIKTESTEMSLWGVTLSI